MKRADMHKKSAADLQKHVAKLREELATADRDRYLSEVKNVNARRLSKREIARALTIARIKQQEEETK